MPDSLHHRVSLVLAAAAVASALAATPALATEPNLPPPDGTLPGVMDPVTLDPTPSTTEPAVRSKATRVVRTARLVPRRVRPGQRAHLKLSLTTPSRLLVVMRRGTKGHRIRAISLPARGRTVTLKLPARSNGHDLRPGRFRVSITAIDAQGARSKPIQRTLIVRHAAG